jgi:hypothetical protein
MRFKTLRSPHELRVFSFMAKRALDSTRGSARRREMSRASRPWSATAPRAFLHLAKTRA